ncbi:lactate utilization protein [Youxingia wuxianensis]|uniref:Lactate utilization protein n=1 Tax=Youxingia wuxianensis TaxID=2763678 RepID=A0A926IBR7_9FIRM|nr:lactate utilization protein [Youxingia wuxianensis]MBC8584397.1 lactate utilization protein [Youxingia wuxianensis]
MDMSLKAIMEKRINKTIGNLQNNKMDAYYAKTKEDAVKLVDSLIGDGETVSFGGSMSLYESGVIDHLRNSKKYNLLDRDVPGLTPQQRRQIFIQAFDCDTYLASSNAVTETGELYNVDGMGNRVAALTFGPKSVILVVGYNKIVKDLNAAADRVKNISAPANAMRLDCQTPCKVLGGCANCRSDGRICCTYVIHAQQREKGRIKVIIVGEPLGY